MSSVFNICGGENASYTPPKKGGGETPSEPMKDVNFIDYDGKIVASYTADEFASLSAMPDNPSHEGLVAQGWNWSFEDAQEYVAENGKLVVGQMYVTESGDTEIDITLREGRLEPVLGIAPNGTVEIDWGDGSAVDTVTGTSLTANIGTQHVYASGGDYTIKLHNVNGEYAILGGSSNSQLLTSNSSATNDWRVYQHAVKKVRMGNNALLGDNAFSYCGALLSVTMPASLASLSHYAFSQCRCLQGVVIPSGITETKNSAFNNCSAMSFVAVPNSVTYIWASAFSGCGNLMLLNIPEDVTAIGNSAFSSCYSMTSIIIPSKVSSIGTYAFSSSSGLKYIILKPTTPPSLANSNAWNNGASDRIFIVPQGTLADYQRASTWSSYASQMQEAS